MFQCRTVAIAFDVRRGLWRFRPHQTPPRGPIRLKKSIVSALALLLLAEGSVW